MARIFITGSVSGRFFFNQKERHYNPDVNDQQLQDKFLSSFEEVTGISFLA
jgi:hypothetical protein